MISGQLRRGLSIRVWTHEQAQLGCQGVGACSLILHALLELRFASLLLYSNLTRVSMYLSNNGEAEGGALLLVMLLEPGSERASGRESGPCVSTQRSFWDLSTLAALAAGSIGVSFARKREPCWTTSKQVPRPTSLCSLQVRSSSTLKEARALATYVTEGRRWWYWFAHQVDDVT